MNHKITRLAISWCEKRGITKLVIGDVSGISKNTKNEKRLNKKNRQKVSQWAFYQQHKYLEYKCEEVGIETELEPEGGTTKACPKCGNKYKPTGRNYDCQNPECNLKMHRDVVGACNIRTKHLTGVLNGDDNFQSPTVKYLRIDDPRLSKSSSVADVNRRERRKPRALCLCLCLVLINASISRCFNEHKAQSVLNNASIRCSINEHNAQTYRRRLGPEGIPKIPSGFLRNVPEQLTLIPLTNVRVKTKQAVRYKA